MMLGSKGILPPMIHGLFRISCSRNPKNIRNPPYSGCFLMFYGSQSHAFSCKHEKHNLLTLVSNILLNTKSIVRDDSRNVKWEGGAKYKNNSKRTCLLLERESDCHTTILVPENLCNIAVLEGVTDRNSLKLRGVVQAQ